MEIVWLIIVMIMIGVLIGFYLLNVILPQEKTKYANGELIRLLGSLPISRLLKVLSSVLNKKK